MAHNAIKYFRTTAGMSQGDLASHAGMSVSTLSRLERKPLTEVPPSRLARIAQALGTTVWVLARVQKSLVASIVVLLGICLALVACGSGEGSSREDRGALPEPPATQASAPVPRPDVFSGRDCQEGSITWIGHHGIPMPHALREGLMIVQVVGDCARGACVLGVHGMDVDLAQALMWERHAEVYGRAWVACMPASEAYDTWIAGEELSWIPSRYADYIRAWMDASVDAPSGATVDGNYIWEGVPNVGAGGQGNVLAPGEAYEGEDNVGDTEEEF